MPVEFRVTVRSRFSYLGPVCSNLDRFRSVPQRIKLHFDIRSHDHSGEFVLETRTSILHAISAQLAVLAGTWRFRWGRWRYVWSPSWSIGRLLVWNPVQRRFSGLSNARNRVGSALV